jgi:hypothetical protein
MSFTDKNAAFIPFCDDKINLPSNLDVPLTITKSEGEIRVDTHISMALQESVWNSYRKMANLNKSEKIVFIACWDTKWNRNASGANGLFTDIIKSLKSL